MGDPPRVAALRAIWRLTHRVRTWLGVRRSFRAGEGGRVYYKETTTVPLWRALSRSGGGVKEYRVTYADGSKQYIQCTTERIYADAMGPLLLARFQVAAGMIRPGSRVLCVPGGTGYAPSWLGRHVGRSGSVVSIESDKESVLFSVKRYGAPNVAFEQGGVEALRGEVDGAFDAVMSITHRVIEPAADGVMLRELWRVTRAGGWMLVGRSHLTAEELGELVRGVTGPAAPVDEASAEGDGADGERGAWRAPVEVFPESGDAVRLAIARKPEEL